VIAFLVLLYIRLLATTSGIRAQESHAYSVEAESGIMKDFRDTQVLPPVLVTAVGSLPHTDPDQAVELILKSLPVAPHPPQLSRSDPREQMWIQFTEGLPRFSVDLEQLSYYFDTAGDPVSAIEAFYSAYMEITEGASAGAFGVGEEYGRGIHRFREAFQRSGGKREFAKVQVTGPLSFALTVTDETRRPIFYHPLFRDVAVKGMGLKAVWLVDQFKALAENVIVFFDEPSLSAYGSSAFLSVSKADVIESLSEVVSMVLDRGAIPGVHCCGNTDWGLLMETPVRIINFDAVDYLDSLVIYAAPLTKFLARGGCLAWGAVPNTERIEHETSADVIRRIRGGVESLVRAGVDRDLLLERLIVTPACGCAGLTQAQAEKVYGTLSELGAELTIEALRA